MPVSNLDITIRVDGNVVKAEPFVSMSSVAFSSIFTPPDPMYLFAYTMRFYQTSNFNPYTLINTAALTAGTTTVDLLFAYTVRFFQSQNYNPLAIMASLIHSSLHPLGIIEEITRPVVEVRDTSVDLVDNIRVDGKTILPLSYQPPTEVYRSATNQTEVIDTLKTIVWWGGGDANDFVYIEYRDKPTASNPYPTWKDSLDCQTWLEADGAGYVQPTFRWSDGIDEDESQDIEYEIAVAFDHSITNILFQKSVGSVKEYTMTGDERLDIEQTYFWAVRAKDDVGDYSEWSRPQSFTTFEFDPPRVRTIGTRRRVVVPFTDYHYDFNVGNLPSGDYQYRAVRVRLESGVVTSQQEIISEYEQRYFIVDHNFENPPQILHIEYDPQRYKLKFDVRILDSKFRSYDIKEVSFADQKQKVLGVDGTGYNMSAFNWTKINLNELIGRRKSLSSNPYVSTSATLGWTHNQGIVDSKTYTFEVLVMTEPEEYTNEFYWGVRGYEPGSSTPSEWSYAYFDNSDLTNFIRPAAAYFSGDIPKTVYHGKANPTGVVMNKAYFRWDRSGHVRWDFALFYKDGSTYTQIPSSVQSSVLQPYARVTPKQFFDYGITNTLLDLVNIEYNFYELYAQEIDKIVEAIPNQDFYWKVRARDGSDVSSWSVPQQSQDFNIHHFEWDVRNDDRFQSSDYIVLRVTIEPTAIARKFEFPHFNWLNVTNPQIDSYTDQIRTLEARRDEVEEHLKSYYNSYINYLKRRIIDVRNYVLDSLINNGYFSDGVSFQGFIDKNLNDGPVLYSDGTYRSQLDIHDEYIERIKDLHLGATVWSPAFYIWQLDKMGGNFKSQNGKPLRQYEYSGLACENESYSHCWLSTQDQHSCPWLGRSDIGFCKGFVQVIESKQQKENGGQIVLSHLNPPDINTDPQAFTVWAYQNQIATDLQEAATNAEETVEHGIGFDIGNCPMAPTVVHGAGKPCSRYKKIDQDVHKHTCEICGEKRYPQFTGIEKDETSHASSDTYSDLNPAGFAQVEIRRGDEQLGSWGPIAKSGQSRNPQHRFTGLKLRKSQLPGELNSDFLDSSNEQGIKKPHFNYQTGESLPVPTSLVITPGAHKGQWFPIQKPPTADSQIVEII